MSDTISAIDKAIQAAQARKAAKANGTPVRQVQASNTDEPEETSSEEVTPSRPKVKAATKEKVKVEKEPKRPKVSDEEKAARLAQRDAERATRKAEREAAREAKRLEKEATKKAKTPHMSKVEKAAAKLPSLDDDALGMFNDITANLSTSMVTALAAHLNHHNRIQATERALKQVIAAGDTVRIISGDPRYIGQVGTVSKAQRIRCYVDVPDVRRPVYLFTSDVELVTEEAEEAEETN